MAKKKTVKKLKVKKTSKPKTVKKNKVKPLAEPNAQVEQLQAKAVDADAIKSVITVLHHILDIFRSSIFDTFRQFIDARIHAELPASINDFLYLFKTSVTKHGITADQLLQSLDSYEQEIVLKQLGKESMKGSNPGRIAVETPQKNVSAPVADKETPKAPAEGIDLSGFGLDDVTGKPAPVNATPAAEPAKTAPSANGKSVLNSLDVL